MSGSGWNHVPLPPATPLFRLGRAEPGLLENTLSLRTSAHAGVAIPQIFKHLGSKTKLFGSKTKLFPLNRGAATPVTSVTGSQRHTFLTAPKGDSTAVRRIQEGRKTHILTVFTNFRRKY